MGIDVSKETLDAARSDTGQVLQFPNTPAGIKKLIAWLPTGVARIVLEATGGLEQPALDAFWMPICPWPA